MQRFGYVTPKGCAHLAASLVLILVLPACAGGASSNPGPGGGSDDSCCNMAGQCTCGPVTGSFTNFAVSGILLPGQATDFALDLNGDGIPDNQLGNLLQLLSRYQLTVGEGVSRSVAVGATSVLLGVETNGPLPSFIGDASVMVYAGKTTPGQLAMTDAGGVMDGGVCTGCPDFSGMGRFTVDSAAPRALLSGKSSTGRFSSNLPALARAPVTMTLRLPLIPGADPLTLVIEGAHIQFEAISSGVASAGLQLQKGELHGSLATIAVQSSFVSAIATACTRQLQLQWHDSAVFSCSLLDRGNCTNPDGSPAHSKDGFVSPCEVATDPVLSPALAPDVQRFDPATGAYAPNKTNLHKDSFSVGIGFTAVRGTYTN